MNSLFDFGAILKKSYHSPKDNPIDVALRMKNIGAFMILLKRGIKPKNSQNDYSMLMLCIANGFDSAVPMLIENGADINIKTLSRLNALQIACNLRKEEIVELILHQPSIDINAEGQGKSTAIHWAAAACLPKMVIMVKNIGGKVNSINPQGENAIYYALRFIPSEETSQREIDIHNQLETLVTLVNYGVSVNLQRTDKSTYIQNYLLQSNISVHCDVRIVKFLFDAGLDISIVVNDKGETLGDKLAAYTRLPDDIYFVVKKELFDHGYIPKS